MRRAVGNTAPKPQRQFRDFTRLIKELELNPLYSSKSLYNIFLRELKNRSNGNIDNRHEFKLLSTE